MNVHIERNWRRGTLDVYLWERSGKYENRPRFNEDGELVHEHVLYNEAATMDEIKPTLSLRPEDFEAIIRAAEGHVHAQDATTKHLDDATATRDRLLAMVEKRGLR